MALLRPGAIKSNSTRLCCIFLLALVNKGNVLFVRGDYEKAREYYKDAITNDSSCVEALYNLGKILG